MELGTVQDSGTGTSGTFSVPAGTHGIGLTLNGQASDLTITGVSTGVEYLQNLPVGEGPIPPGYYVVPISSAADSGVTVHLKSYSGTQTVYVSAILDSQAVAVQNSILSRLSLGSGYQGASGLSVQTVREPPQYQSSFGANVTASPTVLVLDAGTAGQTIRLRRFTASTRGVTSASEIDIQDTNATTYGKFNILDTKDAGFDFEGLPLIASGIGVRVVISATTGAWIGTLTYDKY